MPAVTYVMVRPLVEDRRPSQLYHAVIMEGARSAAQQRGHLQTSNVCWCREHGLPGHYLDTLHRIEHNGEQRGDGSITITLGRF